MFKRIRCRETRIYFRCLFLLPFFIIAALFFYMGFTIPGILLPPCMFHTLTGFSCPGCGCTRAVIALLQGRLLQSICYNPAVLYCALLYTAFVLSHTAEYLCSFIIRKNKRLPSRQWERSLITLAGRIHGIKTSPVYLYLLLYLLLIFSVLRFFAELCQRIL